MRFDGFPRAQSEPHPICWAGFRSDTLTLQQNGWEFSAEQDASRNSVGLALYHRALGMKGYTNQVCYDGSRAGYGMAHARLPFYVRYLTTADVRIQHFTMPDWHGGDPSQPVDMRPTHVNEFKDFEDLFIFAGAPLIRTNEIVVDPHDVSAMMDRILELQDPAKKAHYMEAARNAKAAETLRQSGRQKFHAQIVSLVA